MAPLGTAEPIRKASPFGNPATPSVLLGPNLCHIIASMHAWAPGHRRRPAVTSRETDYRISVWPAEAKGSDRRDRLHRWIAGYGQATGGTTAFLWMEPRFRG
jgi:hypothetical protein